MNKPKYKPEITSDPSFWSEIRITPNHNKGYSYKDILTPLSRKYKLELIETQNSLKGDTSAQIFAILSERGSLKLILKKSFVAENKDGIIKLFANLVSGDKIWFMTGFFSYDKNGKYHYININISIKGTAIFNKVYFNYENINCLFKHKFEDVVTLFCETKSPIYSFGKTEKADYEMWYCFLNYLKDGIEISATDAYIFINPAGNVQIQTTSEKFNILRREIYARNLDEGIEILKREMKNLGFDVIIAEKTKRGMIDRGLF